MVKKFFGIFAVFAVMAAAGYGVLKNANQTELNDLALANIEALGQGEYTPPGIGTNFMVVGGSWGGWHCYNDMGWNCCPMP